MAGNKNIVWISPYFFMPPSSGSRVRIYNLFKQCSENAAISVVTFHDENTELKGAVEEVYELFENAQIHICNRGFSPGYRKLKKLVYALFSILPLQVTNFRSIAATQVIQHFARMKKCDIIQCDEIFTAQIALSVTGTKRVLVLHNVDSHVYWLAWRHSPNIVRKVFFLTQFIKIFLYEYIVIPKFDLCICVSSADKKAFERRFAGKVNFELVSNGVDTTTISPIVRKGSGNRLLFVGVMKDEQNVLSIEWFLKDILPLIEREVPGVSLHVVGREPPPKLLKRQGRQAVTFAGYVTDVAPCYADSDVVIVPLKIGSGTKLKVLEAMAYGRPVVTTPVGAEGLEVQHGENILIANDAPGFARMVVSLLQSPSLYNSISANARKLVEEKYSWDKISRDLERIYESLLA